MEKIVESLLEDIRALSAYSDKPKAPKKPRKDKDYLQAQAPMKRATEGLTRLCGILNKSGTTKMTITNEIADWYWDKYYAVGKERFKDQYDTIIRFFAWRHHYNKDKHGPYVWKTGLMTVFNNWDDQVSKGEAFLEQFGDAPGVKRDLPKLPEPTWDWREHGIYSSTPWNCIPSTYQHKIMKKGNPQ